MRGKDYRAIQSKQAGGITPAYAGKSAVRRFQHFPHRDHPRVCGEKKISEFNDVFYLGSPPRMRGKGRAVDVKSPSRGITPAYAGKSYKDLRLG